MVSFRPLSRTLPLASRAAAFSSCAAPSPVLRHVARRAAAASVYGKLGAGAPGFVPSSFRALTTAREKVKVLLVLYDGGKHAEQVSFPFSFLSYLPPIGPVWGQSLFSPCKTQQHQQRRDSYVKYLLCCCVAALPLHQLAGC